MPRKIKVGDSITFKAATRWGCGTVTRKVVGFQDADEATPEVRYGGWSYFAVKPEEIKKVTPKKGWRRNGNMVK